MLKINFKDGSVLLLAARMHTVYPSAEPEPLLVAHFDDGPPEYVRLEAVGSVVEHSRCSVMASHDFWPA